MGWKASGVATPRKLKFRQIIEPPPPAPSSGNGRGDRDFRPLRETSHALAADEAAREGAAETTPPSEAAFSS